VVGHEKTYRPSAKRRPSYQRVTSRTILQQDVTPVKASCALTVLGVGWLIFELPAVGSWWIHDLPEKPGSLDKTQFASIGQY
jgi:hypothetical protein